MRTILPIRRLKGTGGLPGPLTQVPTIPADWPADRPFTCVDLADPDGTRVSEWKGGRWVGHHRHGYCRRGHRRRRGA